MGYPRELTIISKNFMPCSILLKFLREVFGTFRIASVVFPRCFRGYFRPNVPREVLMYMILKASTAVSIRVPQLQAHGRILLRLFQPIPFGENVISLFGRISYHFTFSQRNIVLHDFNSLAYVLLQIFRGQKKNAII